MALEVSSVPDELKLLLARYQLCVNVEERRRIHNEILDVRRDMLQRLKSRTETWGAKVADRVEAAERTLESQRETLAALQGRLFEASSAPEEPMGFVNDDDDVLPEIELVIDGDEDDELDGALFSERVEHRQNFYRQFLESEDPKHPSESRPHMSCPDCGERGFIRMREKSSPPKKIGLGNIVPFVPARNRSATAYCLNCTHSWQPAKS